MSDIDKISTIFKKIYISLLDEFQIDINDEDNYIEFIKGDKEPQPYGCYISKKFEVDNNSYGYFYIHSYKDKFIQDKITKSFVKLINSTSNFQDNDFDKLENKVGEIVESIKRSLKKEIDVLLFKEKLNLIINLSTLGYEKNICQGNIAYCNNESDYQKLISLDCDKKQRIYFEDKNLKIIRKLLETTNENISLLIRSEDALNGNRYYVDSLSYIYNSELQISFIGKAHFKINYQDDFLIEYYDGDFFVKNKLKISVKDKTTIENFFNDGLKTNIFTDFLNDIAQNEETFHGAIIIVTDDEEFIDRMNRYKRSINVYDNNNTLNLFNIYDKNDNSLSKHKEALIKLTNVDGAIIIDPSGDIKSFGTILDGRAVCNGSRSRGSRYNSTKTFIADYTSSNLNKKYLGVVMSEDGPIDVFTTDDKISQDI